MDAAAEVVVKGLLVDPAAAGDVEVWLPPPQEQPANTNKLGTSKNAKINMTRFFFIFPPPY
jgi:hypothetical protein